MERGREEQEREMRNIMLFSYTCTYTYSVHGDDYYVNSQEEVIFTVSQFELEFRTLVFLKII